MGEKRRALIRDVTQKINLLPEDKRNYTLGVMDGIFLACTGEKKKEEFDKSN